MEKPPFEYKNRLRNTIVIVYWIIISVSFFSIMMNFFKDRDYGSSGNFIVIVIFSLIIMFLIWPIKRLKVFIYIDAIVFKEKGWHPLIKNEFGIVFDNIYQYKIKNIGEILHWIEFKKSNGKTVKRLFSLSENELSELTKTLNEKVHSL